MYGNNNSAAIKRISNRSIKVNKLRNLFAVLGILLTTLLFTTLLTVSSSYIKSFEYSTMRQAGGSVHGTFKNITAKQFNTLRKNERIKEWGKAVFLGNPDNPELLKRQVEIRYFDKNSARQYFVTPLIMGRMPKAENEVVVDTIIMDMMGIKHKTGKTITLNYTINGKKYSNKLIISGFYKGDKLSMSSFACISKKLLDKLLNTIDLKVSRVTGSFSGYIDLGIMLDNKYNIKEKMKKIIRESGYKSDDIAYGASWAYVDPNISANFEELLPIFGLVLLIMISGYLIIYNIFYISVVKDIRFYGLLKTIGMTRRQLKKLIIRQSIALSAAGIPLGLLLGYLVGAVITPLIMKDTAAYRTVVSADSMIFIGASIFSFITVMISSLKPARKASMISPIEAVGYTGLLTNSRKKLKETTRGRRIQRMAFSNLFRSKGKVIVAIISLSLSIILLNCTYIIVTGFDIDKYVKGYAATDFTIGDVHFYRWKFFDYKNNCITSQLCKKISALSGIKTFDRIYGKGSMMPLENWMEEHIKSRIHEIPKFYRDSFKLTLKYEKIDQNIYGADKGIFKLLKPYLVSGEINMKLLKTGNYAVVNRDRYGGADLYKVGDKISIAGDNGDIKKYTVIALTDNLPLYLYSGSTPGCGTIVYIPSKEFISTTKKPTLMTALFNVKHRNFSFIEHYIKNEIKSIPTLDYRTRASYEKKYDDMVKGYSSVGYTLSFVLAFIGILNFANVIITSILCRKKEFATMQSIGMTVGMLRKMVMYEGVFYAVLTIVFALIIGIPVNYFGVKAVCRELDVFKYHFTILPTIICTPFLLLIAAIIPIVSFKNVNKMSVVERLREAE